MPQITNVTLHSFSSEDPNFPAKNLLETNVTRKWKCEKQGEKTAFVVLKLEKPYKISEINIGNEYSAVIEVLVANSQQDPPKFQEILLATSFMTIFETKSERNPNRVLMFNREIFVPAIASQKWDLVKIVCTQTFTNHKQFGLTFISLHTNEEITNNDDDDDSPIKPKVSIQSTSQEETPKSTSKAPQKIGKFRFRDSESDEEEETSPFAQWKNKKNNPSTAFQKVTPKSDSNFSIMEQLKAKMNSGSKRQKVVDDEKPKVNQDRNRSKGLFYESSDDEPNEKLQKKLDKDKEYNKSKKQSSHKLSIIKPTPIKSSSPSSSKFSTFIRDDKKSSISTPERSISKQLEESTSQKKPAKEIKYKPFDKLMEGVTFVISGYQNPERGILRQKALDLGAKYKGDWDDTCTHLICAYSNTPKYNQVKGKGKIVSKKWIENCFIEQKMIPWRRFALDNGEKNKPESDEEILCEWNKPKSLANEVVEKMKEFDDSDDDMLVVDRRAKKNDAKIIIDSDSDTDMVIVDKTNKNGDDDNTESKQENHSDYNVNQFNDDVQQKLESEDSNNNMNRNKQQPDTYSDDDSVSSIDITTVECQAFKDKMFYLNEDLSATDVIKLKDNIKHMLGIVTKNPQKANYVITKQGKKLPSNLKGEVVKEIWIRECFELQAFIPTSRYRISQ